MPVEVKEIAVAVHMEKSASGDHEHIATLRTKTRDVSRSTVVTQLILGTKWETLGTDGSKATIRRMASCPRCDLAPYITTKPDDTTLDNLDKLPRF